MFIIARTKESLNGCGEFTLAQCQVSTKAALPLPSSVGQGRENIMKACRLDKERSFTNHHDGQNRLDSRKLV